MERLTGWLGTAKPDVLCLQELKTTDDAFPTDRARRARLRGGHLGHRPLERRGDPVPAGHHRRAARLAGPAGLRGRRAEPRALTATCGGVRVSSVYVPNGRELGNPHYDYKLAWLDSLTASVAAPARADPPYAVLGDFNVAPTDDDVWDMSLFAESTHVTPTGAGRSWPIWPRPG